MHVHLLLPVRAALGPDAGARAVRAAAGQRALLPVPAHAPQPRQRRAAARQRLRARVHLLLPRAAGAVAPLRDGRGSPARAPRLQRARLPLPPVRHQDLPQARARAAPEGVPLPGAAPHRELAAAGERRLRRRVPRLLRELAVSGVWFFRLFYFGLVA